MLLTVVETAKLLKVSRNYAYKLINCGLLPSIKLGSIKVYSETLNEFIRKYEGEDLDKIMEEMKEDVVND